MSGKRRMLSNNELIRVCRFLDTNRGSLEGKKPERIIATAYDETGIELTRGNLEGIRNLDGYGWVMPRTNRRPPQPERERILSQALMDIYKKLGEEVPDELAAMTEA